MVLALGQLHFHYALLLTCRNQPRSFRLQFFALVPHTLRETPKYLAVQPTFNGCQVFLANAITRMGQAQAEPAIVSQKNQAFAVVIQPPHGVQVIPFLGQQIVNRRAFKFIFARTYHAARLVESDVQFAPHPHRLAIHLDAVVRRNDLRPQFLNGRAIDGYPPC